MENVSGNLYELLGLEVGCSIHDIQDKMNYYKTMRGRYPNAFSDSNYERVEEELNNMYKYGKNFYDASCMRLSKEQSDAKVQEYLNNYIAEDTYNTIRKNMNKINHDNKMAGKKAYNIRRNKMIKKVVATTVGVVLVLASSSIINNLYMENHKKTDQGMNVCVVYTVQEGDTIKGNLDDVFAWDHGEAEYGVTNQNRNNDYLYVCDVIFGINTNKNDDKIFLDCTAKIITIDEAVEMLEKNHSLSGEFKDYADGNSTFVFYTPVTKSLS
ncbi:MAG: hypothetical protein RSB54_01280 [Bacilli bacterium]